MCYYSVHNIYLVGLCSFWAVALFEFSIPCSAPDSIHICKDRKPRDNCMHIITDSRKHGNWNWHSIINGSSG